MVPKERVEQILTDAGVLRQGHFLLTSGRHSDKYMQCAQILQYPAYAEELLKGVAREFADDNVDVVIAPATGGIIIGYELARHLNARSLFTERENGEMTLRRGFVLEKGARVVVAEDVITTGGTVFEVLDIVRSQGAVAVGVALLVDRSMGKIDFGVKTRAAYTADVVSWDADECPLCKEGKLPVVKPGSRGVK